MPVYTIQTPDGRTVDIEGPAGATAEQLGEAWLASPEYKKLQHNPTTGMSWGELAAAGAGKAVSDAGLGLRQLGGGVMDYLRPRGGGVPSRSDELRKEYEEVKRRDAPLMDTGAGMIGNVGGNVAAAILPGGVGIGVGKALTKIPAAARMAQALMTGGKAMVAPTSIPGAVALGSAQGAAQPAADAQDRLTNMAIGGGASAAIPTAIRAGQIGKAFIDPLSATGQRQIVGRALNEAAGSPETAALARSNIQAATQPFVGPFPEGEIARQMMGEIVPGSVPTTAQAAGVPSIAALSRSAGAIDPRSTNALATRLAEQNAARVNQIDTVAGAGGARDFLEANRAATGNQLYGEARRIGIDPAALTPEAQANISAFQARVPDEIMQRARDLAKINGASMDNDTSVQGLHWIKTAIDDKISTAARAGDKELVRAYTGLQSTLLDGLDELSPAYGEARRTFAAMSKPINEMQVAQAVGDASVNRLTGNVQPQAFARALSDKTAATATGRSGATLENTMQPRNLQALQNVQEDLARANFALTAGKEMGGSDTTQKLAYANLMEKSGLPGWVTNLGGRTGVGGLAQKAGQVIYRDANEDMSRQLAQALLDPTQASALMEAGMVNPQLRLLLENARRGGSGIGALTPALLNSAIPRVDVNLDLGQQ